MDLGISLEVIGLMKKMHLKTVFSFTYALIAALTVLLVSVFSGLFINRQFEEYVKRTQQEEAAELADSIGSNYDEVLGSFNIDYVHGMGMYALKEGFIIRLYDSNRNLLWDAEHHDMELCHEVMDGIMLRMKEKRPELKGEFVTFSYDLKSGEKLNGVLEISYYTPYYLNENEFQFIRSLNMILVVIGIISVTAAAFLGFFISKRITDPISGVISATTRISEGDYDVKVKDNLKEQETYELAVATNKMAATLKEQEYLRKRMTDDIAHELRTPVSNISSYMEMMIDDVLEPTPDRLKSCYDELSRLSDLIRDLERLETAESELDIKERDDFDLYSLAGTILQGFMTKIDEKGISCKLSGEEVFINADKLRIGQVIANLLSNAIKYTDENGSINVMVKRDGDRAALTVEDTGIGMSEEDRAHVFERFYRADSSRTRKTGGAGIGLSISKAIVKAHNGTINCESSPGEGSSFVVKLPIESTD